MAPSAVISQKFQVLQSEYLACSHNILHTSSRETKRPLFESNFPKLQLNTCSPRVEQLGSWAVFNCQQRDGFCFWWSQTSLHDLAAPESNRNISELYENSPRGRTESSPQPCQAAQGDMSPSPALMLSGNLQVISPSKESVSVPNICPLFATLRPNLEV